jgi:hypothetical protein
MANTITEVCSMSTVHAARRLPMSYASMRTSNYFPK